MRPKPPRIRSIRSEVSPKGPSRCRRGPDPGAARGLHHAPQALASARRLQLHPRPRRPWFLRNQRLRNQRLRSLRPRLALPSRAPPPSRVPSLRQQNRGPPNRDRWPQNQVPQKRVQNRRSSRLPRPPQPRRSRQSRPRPSGLPLYLVSTHPWLFPVLVGPHLRPSPRPPTPMSLRHPLRKRTCTFQSRLSPLTRRTRIESPLLAVLESPPLAGARRVPAGTRRRKWRGCLLLRPLPWLT